ncbi:MAG: hypothetical protein JW757_01330, partial [Anaerolineales bacterium]|nr:hypothetical protein [Anaerolineales bacterium]
MRYALKLAVILESGCFPPWLLEPDVLPEAELWAFAKQTPDRLLNGLTQLINAVPTKNGFLAVEFDKT